jgi:hypothetical protein
MPALVTRSRLLFHWRSALCTLRTLQAVDAVFSRAANASSSDSQGMAYTAINGQPAWYWRDDDADSVAETPELRLDTDDRLYWPFLALPQAMTIYLKFTEGGTISTASDRILQIGAAAGTAPFLKIESSGTFYRATHDNNDGSAVTVTLAAAPTAGQRVELRLVLNSDGSILLGQSINDATESVTSTSGVNTLAAAWSDTRLHLNSIGATNVGTGFFRAVKVIKGTRTLAQCRVDF